MVVQHVDGISKFPVGFPVHPMLGTMNSPARTEHRTAWRVGHRLCLWMLSHGSMKCWRPGYPQNSSEFPRSFMDKKKDQPINHEISGVSSVFPMIGRYQTHIIFLVVHPIPSPSHLHYPWPIWLSAALPTVMSLVVELASPCVAQTSCHWWSDDCHLRPFGGFHSHGGTPVAGWLVMEILI